MANESDIVSQMLDTRVALEGLAKRLLLNVRMLDGEEIYKTVHEVKELTNKLIMLEWELAEVYGIPLEARK